MIRANSYLLSAFLEPWCGLGDDDAAIGSFLSFDPENGEQVQALIRATLPGHFSRFTEDSQESLKQSLRYFLNLPDFDFEGVFEASLPPFDPPSDARLFFTYIWEVLFEGEDFAIRDIDSVRVGNDPHELNSLKTRP